MRALKKFIGDKAFYRRVMAVGIPILVQNGITNFVSLLDNIMIGQVGTTQMSGVAIVNQLIFIFYLCIFGGMAGAGIFTAQFFGSGDQEGIRRTFRFKYLVGILLSAAGIGVFLLAGSPLINLYLRGEGNPADAALSLEHGLDYLHIMLIGLVPFALSSAYSSTLRETGHSSVPMVASVTAVFVNLCLNYVLIFGHFGVPALGVRGAAIATVIARYIELAILVLWTHLRPRENPFIVGAYRSLYIPGPLLKSIIVRGVPLLINEALWATGMAFINQCYSVRGLDVVAAVNISSTLNNLTSVVYLTMGNVVGIIIGQMLGAQCTQEEVRSSQGKLTALSIASCFMFGTVMVAVSGLFPQIYNTTDTVRALATRFICVSAVMMPFNAYVHCAYFALRSGGKTLVTFLFDSCFVWCIVVPLAYCLSRFTNIPIVPLFALCLGTDLVKCVIGFILLRKVPWMQTLVNE